MTFQPVLVPFQQVPRFTRLHRMLRWVSHYLNQTVEYLVSPDNEPKISQYVHHSGQIYWTVYDPYSNRNVTLTSESDVRAYLDQRYYR